PRRAPRPSQHVSEDRSGPLALLERRHEREADEALAVDPEERARSDDDPVLEEPRRARLCGLRRRHLDPEEHRRLARRDAPAAAAESPEQQLALPSECAPAALDVGLVAPGDD